MDGLASIEPWAREEVEQRLARIAAEERVDILLAVESGSRAWGFPSPDSDYDARFIYLRPWQEYLRLHPPRDVIERAIVDDFDVNGWDIRKALGLLLKHNSVVAEWLASSIRYLPDHPIIGRIGEVADRFFNPRGYARHYASLGQNNVDRWDTGATTLPAKRYFYALRPALCIRALRLNPKARPPMQLQELMALTGLPKNIADEIDRLVALKAIAKETADTTRSREIEALAADELGRADEVPERCDDKAFADAVDAIFRDVLPVGARLP